MLLAFDTSTAACTAALFDHGGICVGSKNEVIGRGHAERLMPMLAELLGDRRADRILVGVGPGSFTGIRVGIAAAHGLAIGWDAELRGMSSLALLAAGANAEGKVAAATIAGHGELFVQQFDGATLEPAGEISSLRPDAAAAATDSPLVVGSGADQLVGARGWGEAKTLLPSAADALRLHVSQRLLPPKPVYARAPDARVREAA
jgi:tRNA threonylcarbamoyladenosine biosynthesis protein TsaB